MTSMPSMPCEQPSTNWAFGTVPPVTGTIGWPIRPCCPEWDTADPDLKAHVAAAAVQALNAKTCDRFVRCERVIPLCALCTCVGGCGCRWNPIDVRAILAVRAPNVAAFTISSVWVGPDVLVEGVDYQVTVRGEIVPLDGGLLDPLPTGDMTGIPGAPGTFGVTIIEGEPVPELMLAAAGDLACQLLAFCQGRPCDIPANAVSVSRDGVTIDLLTGYDAIPTVKLALATWPCQKRARFTDPSMWRTRRGPVY